MKRTTIASIVGLACAALSAGAWAQTPTTQAGTTGDGLWQDVAEASVSRTAQRTIVPSKYRVLSLDNASLARVLASAPKESQQDVRSSDVTLSLPLPDGKYGQFRIVESPIMEDGLAAKYPQIRTYLGQGVTDPSATLRFDVTPKGFRAQILSAHGTLYIDPYQNNDKTHYITYDKRDYANTGEPMKCTVKDAHGHVGGETIEAHDVSPVPNLATGGTLRTYRLALSATGEYTQFHGGTVADALGGMVTTMNRVNGIYEREVGVRMVLVNNTDLSIYTNGATDPFTNDDGETLLGENQYNLDLLVGGTNYDIGHIFSTGGGGIAALGSVCGDGVKGNGVTGSGAPTADAYDDDYVAHEMGHQFGGPHTFNSTVSSCGGGNREATSAYETGSGVTIMAYAGICGSENTQPNSEDYFHRDSLNLINAFITGDGACSVNSATGNTPPTVTATAAYTIPARTPFTLTAAGADADNDALTYVWEEFDLGASTSGTLSDNGSRPIFRSFDPTTSPSRIFPSLRYILNNANVVPATAPLPGTTTPARYTGELLPTTGRTMNFRVTVRDNRAGGGGTNEATTSINVEPSTPFALTAPNTAGITWAAGSTQAITWN
ncbi:MAG TPA: zinc-dependent metalloprotease family protein, partial [Tahibacter sp.]|nr:zinc-dependent metalloprotease family protein [Tahibacter sp.]